MNKAGGFITLHRQVMDWEWYKDVNTFKLFIHLLLSANFTDTRFLGKKIKRGQIVTSLASLAEETGLTVQNTKTALKHLISTNEVTNVSTQKYRVITIVKYDEYQNLTNCLTDNQQSANKVLTNSQQHHNNDNNDNKGTKKKDIGADKPPTPRFKPPTVDEVRAYCLERNNGIDPEYFIDYNEARGWKLKGGQKMKDWKAAIRTWERRNKDGWSRENAGRTQKEDRPDFSFLRDTVSYV